MSTTIVAHRGASAYAPENTLPAFKLAQEQGAQLIELDVHLTKDQIPVIIHDEQLKRTTNGRGWVKDFTFVELQQLDAGSWFSSEFIGTKIISLDTFLNWIKNTNLSVNIELKNNKIDYEQLEPIVCEMVYHHTLENRVILSTFNRESIMRLHKYKRDIQIAFLTSKKRSHQQWSALINELQVNALHFKYTILSHTLMALCKHYNIDTRVYTVNKIAHMLQCFKYKCTSIITDVPDVAILQLNTFKEDGIIPTRWQFWK